MNLQNTSSKQPNDFYHKGINDLDCQCDWFNVNTFSLIYTKANYMFSGMGMIMLTTALVFVLVLLRLNKKTLLSFGKCILKIN